MNLTWAYSFEPSLPREVMRVDADGVVHLDEALLAEILGLLAALDDADQAAEELIVPAPACEPH